MSCFLMKLPKKFPEFNFQIDYFGRPADPIGAQIPAKLSQS
ncbi:MAG: hypothetical protein ACP5IL_17735 [Syntrophobacteraceae bacterium]